MVEATDASRKHVSPTRHILAIEVSNPSFGATSGEAGAGVALGCLEGAAVRELGVEPVRPSGRGGHDDDLMPAIDRLFRRCGVGARDGTLARVAVSVGPGGYTSVRVACAVAKMIAEVAGARCVAVPTASVIARALPLEMQTQPLAVALAGKNDSAWIQPFANGGENQPGRVMTAADVESLGASGIRLLVADRFLPAPMRAAADRCGMTIREPALHASACLHASIAYAPVDPGDLLPIYPREPDAVTLWRARTKS